MPLITITRGSLSASQKLAEELSKELDCIVVKREEIINHAKVYGMEETGLASIGFMEKERPHFWDRHAAERRLYLIFLKASLLDYMVKGNVIYVGHFGQFVLSDVPKLLRIRVDASIDFRIHALMKESNLPEDEAREHIQQIDSRRRDWAKFLYGADYDSSLNYDMVLNREHMSLESQAKAIAVVVKYPEWALDDESMRTIKNIHLASIVLAHLARSPRTRGMELAVDCDSQSGNTRIRGMSPMVGAQVWEQDIKDIAGEVEGVSAIEIADLR